MRRYWIAVILTLLVAAAAVRWNSPSTVKSSDSDANTVADLGPAKLRLVDGTLIDGGKVEPRQHVPFRLPFVNAGAEAIDLSRFRQCAVCCQGGKLVASTGIVPPQGQGELLFDVEAGERPGRITVQAVIEYVPEGPYSESETLPNVRLRLSYESLTHGLCEWELRDFDVGEIAVTGAWKREFVLTEQLYEKGEPALELSCDTEGVQLRVVSQKPAQGLYGIPATNFMVECQVAPENLGCGRHTAMISAKTPLGERKLRLRWQALPEFRFLPTPCVLIRSGEGRQTYRLNLRNLLEAPFVIERVTTELVGVEIQHPKESGSQQTITLQLLPESVAGRGTLQVQLRTSSGQLHEESVPCVVEQLATVAGPTLAD